jgi:4'-phosphopantetheinyl transferase
VPGERHASPGSAPREALPAAECHVWIARVDQALADPAAVARYRAWLAPDERERIDRHRHERDRLEHLATRALARAVLSRYTGAAEPAGWVLAAGSHGKPEVVRPRLTAPLAFNMANSDGVAACAVTLARQVGVDVERAEHGDNPMEVAEACFSPVELAGLRALPAEQRRGRFLTLWTLKEAYIKARGLGLSLPLDAITFDVGDGDRPPGVAFDRPRLSDDPAAWAFAHHWLAPGYQLAVAVNLGPTDPRALRLVVRETDTLDVNR